MLKTINKITKKVVSNMAAGADHSHGSFSHIIFKAVIGPSNPAVQHARSVLVQVDTQEIVFILGYTLY